MDGPAQSPSGRFIEKNTDKMLVLFVLLGFYIGAALAYHNGFTGFGDASIDLVKQLAAAFLTLTVSSRIPWGNQKPLNGGNDVPPPPGILAANAPRLRVTAGPPPAPPAPASRV